MMKSSLLSIGLILLTFSHQILAVDIVRFESGQSDLDTRILYKSEVIKSALEHTVETYGAYEFLMDVPRMNALRAMRLLEEGTSLNVFVALTNQDWEDKTIPIRIPIRRGILSYRLLLIHNDNSALFENINTAEDLKRHTVGLRQSWTTTKTFSHLGFNVIPTSSYDGMFKMLESHRFDFIPRGINEVFGELDSRKDSLKDLAIAPGIALYIPSASYIFVSPKFPRLAERIRAGLNLMLRDGSLEAIFDKYYSENIKKADLKSRRIIYIANPMLPKSTPLHRKELWFNP